MFDPAGLGSASTSAPRINQHKPVPRSARQRAARHLPLRKPITSALLTRMEHGERTSLVLESSSTSGVERFRVMDVCVVSGCIQATRPPLHV